MKKLFLLLTTTFLLLNFVDAQQCTPTWPNGAGPGISPNVTTGLPAANANQPYTTVLQFKVPKDTTYLSFPVTIANITVTGVSGLNSIPSSVGFTYTCNPSNCIFPGDSICCVSVSGTPTTPGTYPITVFITIHTTTILSLSDSVTGYHIDVLPAAGIGSMFHSSSFTVFQNSPNPFSGSTSVAVNMPVSGLIQFEVTNVLGSKILSQPYFLNSGINNIEFNAADLTPGVYFYSVMFKDEKVMKQFVIEKN